LYNYQNNLNTLDDQSNPQTPLDHAYKDQQNRSCLIRELEQSEAKQTYHINIGKNQDCSLDQFIKTLDTLATQMHGKLTFVRFHGIGNKKRLTQGIRKLIKNAGPHLFSLAFYQCKLSDLPREFSTLPALKELDISNNHHSLTLENLKMIAQIKSLKKLTIMGDSYGFRLVDLPKELAELPNLEKLSFRGNRLNLEALHTIAQIKSLEKLDLISNNLSDLPEELTELKNLKELLLIGNPLSERAKEIVRPLQQRGVTVHAYFFSIPTP